MRSHDATYKSLLVLSVLIDVVLCIALLLSLIYHYVNGKYFSTYYIVGFSAFFILFAIFIISLSAALRTRKITSILVTVAVTVARFLCAIIIVIAWMSEYGGSPEDESRIVNDSEKPYNWISNRKGYLIAFTAVYIPVFCAQLYMLNRTCQFSEFVVKNWVPLLICAVVIILVRAIFNHIIFPIYYETFKKWFGLETTISDMKDVLEADYSDLWHESEFCLAYLALQDEHQKLIRIAKSDVNGENPKRFHWANRYSKIKLK